MRNKDSVKALANRIRSRASQCGLIIIDTLNRTYGNGDENNSGDMGAFISSCDLLRETLGTAVLVIHHAGWSEARQRGHSSLYNALDVELFAQKVKKTGDLQINVTKMRDAPEPPPLLLKIQEVRLPDAVSKTDSLVLLPSDSSDFLPSQADYAEMHRQKREAKAREVAIKVRDRGGVWLNDLAEDYQPEYKLEAFRRLMHENAEEFGYIRVVRTLNENSRWSNWLEFMGLDDEDEELAPAA